MVELRKQINNEVAFWGPAKNSVIKQLEEKGINRINLGCGNDYLPNWINVDYGEGVRCDIKINLDNNRLRLPWDDNYADAIYASHILEHIHHLPALKRELARILRKDGSLLVIVPNYNSIDAWGDDTHCRAFSIHSFFKTFWPGMTPMTVQHTNEVKDILGNNLEWLIVHIKGGEV